MNGSPNISSTSDGDTSLKRPVSNSNRPSVVVQQGKADDGDELAAQMVSIWQNPIPNKSGNDLQMNTQIQGKKREGEST